MWFYPSRERQKHKKRRFLEIWQEAGLGTKLKICAKGYRTIFKNNIEGTSHGQIQPISWWIMWFNVNYRDILQNLPNIPYRAA